jgi:DNA-binding sugar fermentation-stimulating protein
MANCSRCGGETELYELGVAICPDCITDRERFHPPLQALRTELIAAREGYRQAIVEFENRAIDRDLPAEHPDRNLALILEEQAKVAGERYRKALDEYGEGLQREPPEDESRPT